MVLTKLSCRLVSRPLDEKKTAKTFSVEWHLGMLEDDDGLDHKHADVDPPEPTSTALVPSFSSSSSSPFVNDIVTEILGRRVVPDGEIESKDFVDNILTTLSDTIDGNTEEVWGEYERIAQSRVPPRTYAETLALRDKAQEECLKKRRWIPKVTKYVATKKQGEVKILNTSPPPSAKRACIPYEKRVEIYKSLCESTDEQRQEYLCGREKFMDVSRQSLRRIWREGEDNNFLQSHRGRKPKLPDHDLNVIYADAYVRHNAGISFSPLTLKQRITIDAHNACLKKELHLVIVVLIIILLYLKV